MKKAIGASVARLSWRAAPALLGVLLLGAHSAHAAPGTPGVPQAPVPIFLEDFEFNPVAAGGSPRLLNAYVGAPPLSVSYTADTAWLTLCNGILASASLSPTDAGAGSQCLGQNWWNATQQLAQALALFRGQSLSTATNNVAVSAYTSGDPGAPKVQFQTRNNIPFAASNRFLGFSVDVAAHNCFASAPLLQFNLLNGAGVPTPVGTDINGCSSPTLITTPALGAAGVQTANVGRYASNAGLLVTGSSFGIQVINNQGSGAGNDFAFDNVTFVDVTPQLDKAFSPTAIAVGGSANLVFTITNTTDLSGKAGWSFTDNFPAGLVVAATPAVSSTCPNVAVAAAPGANSITVGGDLSANMVSCTVTLSVTPANAGRFDNGAVNVTDLVGINPPGTATLLVTPTLQLVKTWSPDAFAGDAITVSTTGGSLGNASVSSTASAAGNTTNGAAVAVAVGDVLTLPSETFTQGSASNYNTSLSCSGNSSPLAGNRLSIGSADLAIICTYTNTRNLVALTLRKTWVNAEIGDAISLSATGLPGLSSVAETSNETDSSPVFDVRVNDVINISESFSVGSAANYTRSLECTGNAAPLEGNQLTISAADTTIVCTQTNAHVPVVTVVKSLTSGGPTASPGEVLSYALTLTNNTPGTTAAAGHSFFEVVPQNARFTAISGGSTSCTLPAPAGTLCTISFGAPVSNGTPQSMSVSMTVDDPLPNTVSRIFNLVSDNTSVVPGGCSTSGAVCPVPPTTCGSGQSCVSTPVTPAPSLSLDKTAGPPSDTVAGAHIDYGFLVSNTGNVALSGLLITDPQLDAPAVCAATTLAIGASTKCTGRHTLSQAEVDAGVVDNTATATGTPPSGPAVTSAPDSTSTPIARTPAQGLSKLLGNNADEDGSGNVSRGDTLGYTITLINQGNTTLSNVELRDPLISPASILCASLAPGDRCVLQGTYQVTQADADAAERRNTAQVINSLCTSTSTSPDCRVSLLLAVESPRITVRKTVLDASGNGKAEPGEILTYTLTLSNSGRVADRAYELVDQLDPRTSFIGTELAGVHSAGTVRWTGLTVPASGTLVLTLQARVNETSSTEQQTLRNIAFGSADGAPDCTLTPQPAGCADIQLLVGTVDVFKRVSGANRTGPEGQGAYVGDVLSFTVTARVSGGPTGKALLLVDTRTLGLKLLSVPEGCSANERQLRCSLPLGTAPGDHTFAYTAEITDDAGASVDNVVKPSYGSCRLGCSTSTRVLREVSLRISKKASPGRVKIGDFVRYEVLVENLTGPDARQFLIVDQPAPGLSFAEGSLRLEGDPNWRQTSTVPLTLDRLDLPAFKRLKITYLMRVNAGAARGPLCNKVAADDVRKFVKSNVATACVQRMLDPDFEETRILGTVFEDLNRNGVQDEGEEGIAGVRLATATGLVIETDYFGRYHIEGLDPGELSRGRNFIVMLDETTLAKGSLMSTQNPLVKRLTWGLPAQFDFGVGLKRAPVIAYEAQQQAETPLVPPQPQPQAVLTPRYVFGSDGLFAFDKYRREDITEPGLSNLKHFVQRVAQDFSEIERITLRAHTDRFGSDGYNQQLSQRRAETVKQFMVEGGLPAALIELQALGEREPLVVCPGAQTQANIDCLAPNRRFELQIFGKGRAGP